MKIYHTIPEHADLFKNPIVTIGNFDGVHLGHAKILKTLKDQAKKVNGDPVVITFSSHPRKVLNPEFNLHILTTSEEKVNAVFDHGIDNIILLHFTREMAEMSAEQFFNEILLQKLDVKELVIGYDHAFGKNRTGNFQFLQQLSDQYNFKVTRVAPVLVKGKAVSSSWVRNELLTGNVELVNELLGRNYIISGCVVHGNHRGKKLGFPTANIRPNSSEKIIPADGVYAVRVHLSQKTTKYGMLNIGTNPTFHQKERSIEVHIFDYNENLYDLTVSVEFISRIRNEKTFGSSKELVKQMTKDESEVRKIFNIKKIG